MFSLAATILQSILGWLFKKPSVGDKAIDTVIAEKDNVLKEVQDAKNLRDNISDADIAIVSTKFERQD